MKSGKHYLLTLPPGTVVLRYEPGSYEQSKVKEFPLDYLIMSFPAPMVFHPVLTQTLLAVGFRYTLYRMKLMKLNG